MATLADPGRLSLRSPAMTTLRIALLGTGWIASVHARSITRSGAKIVAVCGRDAAKAAAFIKDHTPGAPGEPGAQAFGDFAAMLDEAKPDAVYIAIPPHAHRGQTELAAARGIHVFLEKPIALDVDQARAIAGAVRRAGVVSQVGFHMRHGFAVAKLKQMIADGSAGRPTVFQGSFHCNCLHQPWWRDKDRCGGQVFEQVIHVYDLACYLMGDATAVWGQLDNLVHQDVPGYTVEDTSVGTLRHVRGAMSTIVGSNCAVPMEWATRFTVVCEKVTATFSDLNYAEFAYPVGDSASRRETVAGDTDMHAAETADFLRAIRTKGRANAPVEDGLRSLEVVSAVVESAHQGGRPTMLSAPLITSVSAAAAVAKA